jgi:hypothetical protein
VSQKLLHLDPFAAAFDRTEKQKKEATTAPAHPTPSPPPDPADKQDVAQQSNGVNIDSSVESTNTPSPSPPPGPSLAHPQAPPAISTRTATAPVRDFNKRANSIDRDALPSGLFAGKSKNTYDALYLRTRGSIRPARSIQAKKREIMTWAGIQNEKTVESHLSHLRSVGLIVRHGTNGDNEGFVYEVFTPEELGLDIPPPQAQTHPQPQPMAGRNMGLGAGQNLAPGGLGQTVARDGTYAPAQTSDLKTDLRTDDEPTAFGLLCDRLQAVSEELTGRTPTASDAARWAELAEVLAAELRIAAARTTVSSVPAFLAEHLRRRLWKVDKRQASAEGRELPDSSPAAPVKAPQNCPDCKGAGWWYPQGQEKGVAKCKHERLASN